MEKQKSAKGKIQEICDILKSETIEPAKQEASELLENAHIQAADIIKAAEEEVREMVEKAQQKLEKDRKTFDASLNLACKQTVEKLKHSIEKELFSSSLEKLLEKDLADPKLLSNMIVAIVEAIEKEGLDADLSALVSKEVPAKKVSELVGKTILEKLRNQEVSLGGFKGGVQVKLHERKVTVDLSMEALKELLSSYVRKEFRDMIFSA